MNRIKYYLDMTAIPLFFVVVLSINIYKAFRKTLVAMKLQYAASRRVYKIK